MKNKIWIKLSFNISIFVVLLSLSLSTISLIKLSDTMRISAEKNLTNTSMYVRMLFKEALDKRKSELKIMADSYEIKSMDWNIQEQYLTKRSKELDVLGIQVSNINGITKMPGGIIFDLSSKDNFKKTIENEKVIITPPLISEADNKLITVITTPIFDDDKVLQGVLGIRIDSKTFSRLIKFKSYDEEDIVFIIDSSGNVIAHNDEKYVMSNKNILKEYENNNSGLMKNINKLIAGNKGFEEVDVHDKRSYFYYEPIPDSNLYLGIIVSKTNMMEPFYKLRSILTYTTFIFINIGIVISIMIANSIKKPIDNLTKYSKKLADGLYNGNMDIGSGFTEIDYLAKNFEHMSRKIQSREEEMKHFSYIVSHDLQEPLRMVTSYLQIIEKKFDVFLDENGRKYLFFAVDGADRMKCMIQDMLLYSRAGGEVDLTEKVDLKSVMENVKKTLLFRINEEKAVIEYSNLPMIKGNNGKLEQLFTNLITNALKYHGEQPPLIKVIGTEFGDYWLISVIDNGIGIEPRFLKDIFKVFKRLHTRDSYEGTGIGLSICMKIMEKHNGIIYAESDGLNGTKIVMKFKKDFK